MYSKAGLYAKAAEAYRKALEIAPDFTGAKNNLAIVLKQIEEKESKNLIEKQKKSELEKIDTKSHMPELFQQSSPQPSSQPTKSTSYTPIPELSHKDENLMIGIVPKGNAQSAEVLIKALRKMGYHCLYLSQAEQKNYRRTHPARTTVYYRDGLAALALEVAKKVQGTQDVFKHPVPSPYPVVILVTDDVLRWYPQ